MLGAILALLPLGIIALSLGLQGRGIPPLIVWALLDVISGLGFLALNRAARRGWPDRPCARLVAAYFILRLILADGYYVFTLPWAAAAALYALGTLLPAVLFQLPLRQWLGCLAASHLAFTVLAVWKNPSPMSDFGIGLLSLMIACLASWFSFRQRWQSFQENEALLARLEGQHPCKDEAIAIAAHDLRSPLTNLKSLFDILQNQPDWNREPYAEVVRETRLSCANSLALISRLLEAHQVESSTSMPIFQQTHLTDVISRSIEKISHTATERGVQIEFPRGEPPVTCDPFILERLLDNLLSNALKFSPAGSVIQIRQSVSAGTCTIEVEDEGCGIPESERSRLFQKFHRGPSDGKSPAGSGLGLFIVRQLAERMGGTVHHRPAESRGSVFVLRLPG